MIPCAMASLADERKRSGIESRASYAQRSHRPANPRKITVAVNHVVGRHLVSKGFNFLYPRITEQDAMTYYPNKITMNISWRYVTLLK